MGKAVNVINFLLLVLTCWIAYSVDLYSQDKNKNSYQPKIIGWYTCWSTEHNVLPLAIIDIDASKLTHLNISFLHCTADGSVSLENEEKIITDLKLLRKKYPHLKIFLSVGGGKDSGNFSHVCKNIHLRRKLTKNLIEFSVKHGFDGIDIDWEFPGQPKCKDTEKDHVNFIALLQEIKKNISNNKYNFELSVSVPGSKSMLQEYNLETILTCADWLNVMTYNYAGSWRKDVFHHTALYPDTDASITYLLKEKKIDSRKVVFGIALYGRSFKVEIAKPGEQQKILGGANAGPGLGTINQGAVAFWHIQNLPLDYKEFWDDAAKVPYRYNEKTREVVAYDNEQSLQLKCDYVQKHNLGGVMIWELWKDCRPSWKGLSIIHTALYTDTLLNNIT